MIYLRTSKTLPNKEVELRLLTYTVHFILML